MSLYSLEHAFPYFVKLTAYRSFVKKRQTKNPRQVFPASTVKAQDREPRPMQLRKNTTALDRDEELSQTPGRLPSTSRTLQKLLPKFFECGNPNSTLIIEIIKIDSLKI